MKIIARIKNYFKRQPASSDTIGWLDYSAGLGYLPPALSEVRW